MFWVSGGVKQIQAREWKDLARLAKVSPDRREHLELCANAREIIILQ